MRKDAREVVYKVLYAQNFTSQFDDELFAALQQEFKLNDADKDFSRKLLNTIVENYDELTEIIGQLSLNYMLERVYLTDKCALLIGLCEMKYFDDVPNIVAIDEALSLCKKYSTEKSLSFVNGIFAKYKSIIEKV